MPVGRDNFMDVVSNQLVVCRPTSNIKKLSLITKYIGPKNHKYHKPLLRFSLRQHVLVIKTNATAKRYVETADLGSWEGGGMEIHRRRVNVKLCKI